MVPAASFARLLVAVASTRTVPHVIAIVMSDEHTARAHALLASGEIDGYISVCDTAAGPVVSRYCSGACGVEQALDEIVDVATSMVGVKAVDIDRGAVA